MTDFRQNLIISSLSISREIISIQTYVNTGPERHGQGQIQDLHLGGGQVERRRSNSSADTMGCGKEVSLCPLREGSGEGAVPLPRFFLVFGSLFGAFWEPF